MTPTSPTYAASPHSRPVLIAIAVLLGLFSGGYMANPSPSSATSPTPARQGTLGGRIHTLSSRIGNLQSRVNELQRRENAIQAELNLRQARADQISGQLRQSRSRLVRLKRQLANDQRVLAARLTAIYKSGEPDIISVVLESEGFAQMIERATYLHHVAIQDQTVILGVRNLRSETTDETVRLTSLSRESRRLTTQVRARRDEIASAKQQVTAQVGNLSARIRRDRSQLAAVAARGRLEQRQRRSDARPRDDSPPSGITPFSVSSGVTLHSDGSASAPSDAPAAIKAAVAAGNQIRNAPYLWGGGHGSFESTGYDCSGSLSYVPHAAGTLENPLTSGGLESWGVSGPGQWITVFANAGHTFMSVGGVWFDTSGRGSNGSRWQGGSKPTGGYVVRHFPGL